MPAVYEPLTSIFPFNCASLPSPLHPQTIQNICVITPKLDARCPRAAPPHQYLAKSRSNQFNCSQCTTSTFRDSLPHSCSLALSLRLLFPHLQPLRLFKSRPCPDSTSTLAISPLSVLSAHCCWIISYFYWIAWVPFFFMIPSRRNHEDLQEYSIFSPLVIYNPLQLYTAALPLFQGGGSGGSGWLGAVFVFAWH